jgi:hypothetical protein
MKILNEKPEEVVRMDCEFEDNEQGRLIGYAIKNMTIGELKNLVIEWAFIDILKKQLK